MIVITDDCIDSDCALLMKLGAVGSHCGIAVFVVVILVGRVIFGG